MITDLLTTIRPVTVEELPLCIPHGQTFYDSRRFPGVFDPALFLRHWQMLYTQRIGVIIGFWESDRLAGGIGGLLYRGPYDGRVIAQETFWWLPQGGLTAVRLLKAYRAWAVQHRAQSIGVARFHDTPRLSQLYERLGFPEAETYHVETVTYA